MTLEIANMQQCNNLFSIASLRRTLFAAKAAGYRFLTLSQYKDAGAPAKGAFILRLDLDLKPLTLKAMTKLARELKIPFTLFVRVSGPYNFLWYPNFRAIADAASIGCEIGLHGAPVEWGTINGRDLEATFSAELGMLRSYFKVVGFAPHRDVNYMYNSLPWLEKNWQQLRGKYGLSYHAYEDWIISNLAYVNEGLSPHLGWRSLPPEEVMATGRSINLLLHPHWWFEEHAFEID